MTNFMHIQVASLKAQPRLIAFGEPVTVFPDLVDVAEQGNVSFPGMINGQLTAMQADGLIEVEGQVQLEIIQPCSRCLKPVPDQIKIPVALTYARITGTEADEVEEKELSTEEVGLIPYQDDEIDLSAELAQEIIMALPQQPLCDDECSGLCPACGIDLNTNKCDCPPRIFHGGLAALKDFKVDK